MNNNLNYTSNSEFIASYITLKDGLPIPAIFQRHPTKPGVVRLHVISLYKRTHSVAKAIAIAKADLAIAMTTVEPIAHLVPGTGPLMAALYRRGYNWLGFEKVEMKLVPEERGLEVAVVG